VLAILFVPYYFVLVARRTAATTGAGESAADRAPSVAGSSHA
jgi:hypothetical protein